MSTWTGEERRQRDRRDRRNNIAAARRGPWGDLHAPIRLLVFLLIALCLTLLYQQAQFILSRVFGVLLLFVFAAIAAMLLNPLVDAVADLDPLRTRRGTAVLAVNLLIVGLLVAVGAVLVPSVASQASSLGDQAPALASRINGTLLSAEANLSARGIPLHLGVPTGLESLVAPILGSAIQIITGTVGVLVNLLLVLVIAIYLQLQGRQMIAALRQVFPRQQALFDFTLVTAGTTLAGYVRGQVIFAAVMAVYTGVVLSLIGVHFALVIALITFVLELVPLVGAPVAMALAVAFALLQGPVVLIAVAVATLVGHLVGAYTIGLRLIGNATRLHPLVAMAALLLGSSLGGILGALFAIPLAGIVNVYLGAMFRARRGQAAFALPGRTEAGQERLPSLGDEITQMAEDERIVNDPVPRVAAKRAPRKRSPAKGSSRAG
ncbi:MAG TPA: AI-2E family transporter [Candidatus Dormibacteraeota bacterium]